MKNPYDQVQSLSEGNNKDEQWITINEDDETYLTAKVQENSARTMQYSLWSNLLLCLVSVVLIIL